MASYEALRGIFNQDALRNRVEVALIVKAADVIGEATPPASRLAWAKEVLGSSVGEAESFLKYILAANKNLTVEQINGASDEAITSAVSAAVDALYQ